MGKLTPKKAVFIEEVLVDGNGTRAAIASGVPERSAAVTASRWLKDSRVASILAERRARRVEKLEEVAGRLDRDLMSFARADVGRLYDAEGNLIPVHLLPEDIRRAINAVEDETRGGKRLQRVKMVDKLRAAEILYKRLGLFGEPTFSAEVTPGAGGLPADSTIKVVLVRPE